MVIDTHVHIGGEANGFHMNEEMVLTAMERYNIDFCVVSNADAGEMNHRQQLFPEEKQMLQETALASTLAFAKQHPGKIGVAPWVKPYLQGLTPELEQMMRDNSDWICAIKLHPFHSNVLPTDERVLPYLELAEQLQLPVVSHTGGCEAARPLHLYEAAKLFPNVNFVMVHMGIESDHKEALDLLGRADNLYGDTTWVSMDTTIEVIKRYGSKRMVFGSDMPIDGIDTYLCNPKGDRSIYQDYFHVLPEKISPEAYEDLMWKNAVSLFRLEKMLSLPIEE